MTLLYSAPLASNLLREGGVAASDTDFIDIQTSNADGEIVGYSAESNPTGIPSRVYFDGSATVFDCVANATGGEASGTRSELRLPALSVPPSGYTLRSIRLDFLAVSMPVVADGDTNPGCSILQMHCGVSGQWLTWMIFETNGLLSVAVPSDFASASYTLIGSARYLQGQWNRICVKQRMSKDATGELYFYLNDVLFAKSRGRNCHDDTSVGPYLKIGVYNIIRRSGIPNIVIRVKNMVLHENTVSDTALGYKPTLYGAVKT